VAESWGEVTAVGAKKAFEGLEAITDAENFAAAKEAAVVERKTITNWKALYDAGLKPTYIQCDGYLPMHPYNEGCHSAMHLDPYQLMDHVDKGHGGGFLLSFKLNYRTGGSEVNVGKPWEGWKKFEEAGAELRDFRCDICNEEVKLTARSILRHIKPHTGKSSRLNKGGDFRITLGREALIDNDEEE